MAKKKGGEGLSVPFDRVRNIGIAAHIDAGKTTLTERILFYTGASHKIGEVHDGAATMDFMAEEKAHGITIGSAVTQCPWKEHLIQVVDTPGHVDFTIEVERAMRVLDGAVIVMDGVRGVEPQTETVWRQASRFEIPRVLFVNKMDRPGADLQRAMESVEKRLGGHPVPVCVPLADDLTVMDLIRGEIVSFSGDRGVDVSRSPIPDHLMDLYQEHRETMLLACAEEDPELEDMVLEEADIPMDRIVSALRSGTMSGRMHPVFGGSALRNWGVQPLLDGVLSLLPNPLERPPAIARNAKTNEEALVEMTAEGSLLALAFKVQLWDGRRHVFVRIYRGRIDPGQQVVLAGRDKKERVARIFEVNAGNKSRANGASAGQIVLLAGLRHATTGDTLCAEDAPELLLERIDTKEPVLGLAIEAQSSAEEEKLLEVLGKICEEDPTVRFVEDKDTGERVLRGMGELHLQIIFERIQREYGLKVRAGRPSVMTRETIAGSGKGNVLVDRLLHIGDSPMPLKARCVAEVSPQARDAGISLQVEPTILPAGMSLTQAQAEAVEAGVKDATTAGPSEGAPLQDVAVRLTQVQLFAEGSTPQALRIAASQAVREAMVKGGGLVLRPLMKVEVVVPDENLGSVLGDLQSRGASITGQESEMGTSTIHAECGLHKVLGYTTQLRSMTRGRGQFTMEFARFDVG
jgi:elongation factor G